MTITEFPAHREIPLILVVDDDRSTRTLLKVAMEEEGYQVITAKDGEECLTEYSRCSPNMVLLDAIMPEMDGFTCCKKLHQLSSSDFIPILMITSLDDQESIDMAFAAGAVDYITKPIHWAVLAQRVKRLLTTSTLSVKLEQAQKQLQKQQEWMGLLGLITQQLSQAIAMESFLKNLADKISQVARAQRVIIYQRDINIESVNHGYVSLESIPSAMVALESLSNIYSQLPRTQAFTQLETANLPENVLSFLYELQVISLLIVPIINDSKLWGLLFINYCQTPYIWQDWEIEQFDFMASLLALAVNK